MKILSSLIGLVVFILVLVFALSNRQMAAVSLWPFDVDIESPLCLLVLGALFFGLFIGAVIAWLSLLPQRILARRLHKQITTLKEQIDDLQSDSSTRRNETAVFLPSRPRRPWPFGKDGS